MVVYLSLGIFTPGTFTFPSWHAHLFSHIPLPSTHSMPEAQFFIRAYTVCGKNEDGKNLYCAWGESVGQRFAVRSWDSVPTWLLAVTIPCMCVGPLVLAAYTVYKFWFAKKNN